jgi:hypothetical protein
MKQELQPSVIISKECMLCFLQAGSILCAALNARDHTRRVNGKCRIICRITADIYFCPHFFFPPGAALEYHIFRPGTIYLSQSSTSSYMAYALVLRCVSAVIPGLPGSPWTSLGLGRHGNTSTAQNSQPTKIYKHTSLE